MTTRKKSEAVKFLEEVTGGPLTLGRLMESIRLCEGYSQTAFAKKLKISSSHLCDIEKGRKLVSPKRAASVAKRLGHSEQQFVRLALQDIVNHAGLNLEVEVKAA